MRKRPFKGVFVAQNMHNKLIVILGPTASGKTDLSVRLAKKFNGEIVSADSRQVYKGLNIGSGKITKKETQGIPHHLLDIANPKRKFTVAQFQKLGFKEIKKIQKQNKIPFLVGGTGFYIQSIVNGILIPEVKPNWKLRKKLEKKSNEELYKMLLLKDPDRAKFIDRKNPRRLVRALEIVLETGKPVPKPFLHPAECKNDILQIGIKKSSEQLKKLIHKRLLKRIKEIIAEVRGLHKNGLSWKRLEELGLEYRYVAQYLQDKILYNQMLVTLEKESWQYAKRQMTWFKRDKEIHWIDDYKKAEQLVKNFVK